MPLPVYDTQDLVPADQRDDYVEHEGKWHPKVVVDLETERQKRTALLDEKKKEKERREAAERERDELKRTKEAADSGVTEAALKKIRDDEAAARKPIEDENKILRDENRKLKLTDRVRALYLSDKVGGMADRADDAMDLLFKKDHERVDLGDADGLMFKDEKGQVTADDAETFFSRRWCAGRSNGDRIAIVTPDVLYNSSREVTSRWLSLRRMRGRRSIRPPANTPAKPPT
jgi:hypothetical protein